MIRRVADRWGVMGAMLAVLVSVGTLAGMVWGICNYPIQWTDNTRRLNKLEPEILKLEDRQTESERQSELLRADMRVIVAQYADIKEDLHFLRREKEK